MIMFCLSIIKFLLGCLLLVEGIVENAFIPVVVQEVMVDERIVLKCGSVDDEHVFMFWYSEQGTVIGPRNIFDTSKFQYEVVSGNLTMQVTATDTGSYTCVSEGITTQDVAASTVRLLIRTGLHASAQLWTAWAILGLLLAILLILYVILLKHYHKTDNKLRRYFDMTDTNEDEDSTEELFTREPSTSAASSTKPQQNDDNFDKMYTAINVNHT